MKSVKVRPSACKKRDITEEGLCSYFSSECVGDYEEYQKAEDKYLYVTGFFRSYLQCNAENLEDCSSGSVTVPKWAFKAVAEAFEYYFQRREMEHDLDTTLDDAFGRIENKQETIRKLHARYKDIFFMWVNRIRMQFGLNVKDATTAAWKIVAYEKEKHPVFFYNFNASPESMLDAYYRAYPQHVFIQWVVEQSQRKNAAKYNADFWMDHLKKQVPEAATYIKRKMKQKTQ